MTSASRKLESHMTLPWLRRRAMIVDELDRRAIAPMQVLGDQQQRPALGVAVQEFAHLAQHSLQIDSDELAQQGFALLRGAEPGQLQQPGRRDSAQ